LATQLLDYTDAPQRKSALGQFMTPVRVARFMASLFPPTTLQTCSLLDAGAGVCALSSAFLDRVATSGELNFQNVEVEAYEIDNALRGNLDTALATYSGRLPITLECHPVTSFGKRHAKGSKARNPFPTRF
jgi:adenine-specific DNA-methyltransferase